MLKWNPPRIKKRRAASAANETTSTATLTALDDTHNPAIRGTPLGWRLNRDAGPRTFVLGNGDFRCPETADRPLHAEPPPAYC